MLGVAYSTNPIAVKTSASPIRIAKPTRSRLGDHSMSRRIVKSSANGT
jgi:hypothetical protein